MVAEEPKVSLNARYSINQACGLLGVHRNTLLNYTNEGKIRFGVRRGTSRKFYLGSEIVRFWKAQLF